MQFKYHPRIFRFPQWITAQLCLKRKYLKYKCIDVYIDKWFLRPVIKKKNEPHCFDILLVNILFYLILVRSLQYIYHTSRKVVNEHADKLVSFILNSQFWVINSTASYKLYIIYVIYNQFICIQPKRNWLYSWNACTFYKSLVYFFLLLIDHRFPYVLNGT